MAPYLQDSVSSASSEHSAPSWTESHASVIDDNDYPAVKFPGYDEKPLSEQLEPIAVVGMGCRLPGGVKTPSEFWDLMINKGTGRTPKVPESRFHIDGHFHPNNERPGSFNVLGGYFLHDDLQAFDPQLFGISPIEAMWMDPQQRKLLEVVYEAFESGGVTLESISGSTTGVFVGSFTSDYQQMSFKEPDFRHSYAATGVDPGIIGNRISHVFNLHGPSMVVNTACSSSVYALHNACNALRNRECTGAVVGGTNLILTVDQHMNTAKLGVLSPTSTCRTFDASADGYGRAEAVGAVYLKRLSDAVRDDDPIRAVIRSSAVNSNGKAPGIGITHPNLEGQKDVIQQAYRRGGDLDPRLTGYFEIHGTGTPVGDPLEVHAVALAMNASRTDTDGPLLLGAVKTNIGHSEAASGLSAVIKACLTVEAGIIPPTRGLTVPNPKIHWKDWKVAVVTEPRPFPAHLPVQRVSVNSFGYGGTNGHIVLESVQSFLPGYAHGKKATAKTTDAHSLQRPYLLLLSAHDKPTLRQNIAAYEKIVGDYDLLDLSYTLARRRSRHQVRGYVVASPSSVQEAFGQDGAAFVTAEKKKRVAEVGFVFTGQGAQWATMGSELMKYYPTFLATIRFLDGVLHSLPDAPAWSLEASLLAEGKTSRVDEAEFSQPLCTAIQIAVVELLRSWNIRPKATVGHSSGEIAAAFAAGLISSTEAIIVAFYRGQAVKAVHTDGAMLAVGLGAEEAQPYLETCDDKVVVACHNSPCSVTLSGHVSALEEIKAALDGAGIFARLVRTGGKAYHSQHMQPSASVYKDLLQEARAAVSFGTPVATGAVMVSSVCNDCIHPGQVVDEQYWCQNLVSPVLFHQAVQTMVTSSDLSIDALIEIGPHTALSGPIRQIVEACGFHHLAYIPTLVRHQNSAAQLLKTAGELFLADYPVDLATVTAVQEPSVAGSVKLVHGSVLVDLPSYQWHYPRKLWAESRPSLEHRTHPYLRHDVLGKRMPGCSAIEPVWRNILRIRDLPWLRDHSLGGEAVFPAAGYFSMAIEAVTQLHARSAKPVAMESYVLRDVSIKTALVTPDNDQGIEVLFSMRPSVWTAAEPGTWWDFRVMSVSEAGHWNEHATGTIGINTRRRGQAPKPIPNLPQRTSGQAWNESLRAVGFDYGPTFQGMSEVQSDGKNYVASTQLDIRQSCGALEGESRHVLHPGTVDLCLQLIIISIYAGNRHDMLCGVVPSQVAEVVIWPPTADQLAQPTSTAYAFTSQRDVRSFVTGAQLVASNGELLVDIADMRVVSYEAAVPPRDEAEPQPYQEMVWKPVEGLSIEGAVSAAQPSITLVYREQPAEITSAIETALTKLGYRTKRGRLDAADVEDGDAVILLADLEGAPLLATVQETEFVGIQHLTSKASSLLWVTAGGLLAGKRPEYAMTNGLARSVTSEQASLALTTLDFDLETTSPTDIASLTAQIAHHQLQTAPSDRETEFCVDQGRVFTSRLMAHRGLASISGQAVVQSKPFQEGQHLLAQTHAGKITWAIDQREHDLLDGRDVEVKLLYGGLHQDTSSSHGICGVVSRVGAGVTEFGVGDLVVGFSFDRFATFRRTSADLLQKIEMDDVIQPLTSALWSISTALYGLQWLAHVEAGETVLVVNTGPVGAAAVRVAQALKATPFVVAASEAEAGSLAGTFGLPRAQVVGADSLTADMTFDVVFASSASAQYWRHMAPLGRFLDLCGRPGLQHRPLDVLSRRQSACYLSWNMLDLYAHKPHVLAELLRASIALSRQQESWWQPPRVFPLAETEAAVASLSDSLADPGTLIAYRASEHSLDVQSAPPTLRFRADATYLLVGCLGGLGRSLTSWMAEKGARRFAFLSRSGTDQAQARILVADLEAAGMTCQVIRGDVAVRKDVERAVASIPAEFPIRGVVQAAMVLRDGLFHSMPYENWTTVIRPKVLGTSNLQAVLGDLPLDFFVTTSSTSGTLGTPGQANYAAANSFLDALARHRVRHGQRACSLVLPMVLGVGYVAEHPEVEEALRRKGIYGIDETHLLESFAAAMLVQQSHAGGSDPVDHVVVGLDPVKLQQSVGSSDTTDGFWLEDVRFQALLESMKSTGGGGGTGAAASRTILTTIRTAPTAAAAVQATSDYFTQKLSRLLVHDLAEFEPDAKAIADYGLDSMIGAELRNWIFKELGLDIPFQRLLGPDLTITKFAMEVCANQGVVLEGSS